MIPARVALALQQPYYAGKIRDERDRIWLAAMVEAEGCMFIHRRGEGLSNGQGYFRQNASYGAGLEVASTDRVIVERCQQITHLGSICQQTPTQNNRRKLTIYRWSLRSNVCRDVIRELYPHMIAKQHEARLVLGCPSSGPEAEKAWMACKAIHQGASCVEIDFPVPASLYEPGWWLRSDIIWSKCNPMPESVTDRPTKSHEYVFLLTKSEKYWYDADAIKEPSQMRDDVAWRVKYGGYPASKESKVYSKGPGDGKPDFITAGPRYWPETRNKRSVWTIPTRPFKGAHFATFPPALVEVCLKAGCPPGGTVLDPFCGSGTTLMMAEKLGMNGVGIDLNPAYIAMAERRIKEGK